VDPTRWYTREFRGSSHSSRDQGGATSGEEPDLNAFAERFVLSVRSECLDRIIPLGDWHLRHAVSEYLKHYHQERNHQGLGNVLIDSSLAANDNCRVASPPTARRAPQLLPPRSGLKESTDYRHSTTCTSRRLRRRTRSACSMGHSGHRVWRQLGEGAGEGAKHYNIKRLMAVAHGNRTPRPEQT